MGKKEIEIREATTDAEVLATLPVMLQLRPHLAKEGYLPAVRRQQRSGYRLAAALEGDTVRAVAGFRLVENLAWGRFLYVDDLVSDESARSRGHGTALLDWLVGEARREDCAALHLDSGTHRAGAHRFYFREGLYISSYHFARELK